MRVGFFGQTGPYAPAALRELARGGPGWEIALVVEGRRRGSTLRDELVEPAPGTSAEGEALSQVAAAAGLRTLVTSDVNAEHAVARVRTAQLDWIVCVGFDRLFSPALLGCAAVGGINAHPSALPKLRGPAPIFWAVRAGARSLAVTLHGLDAAEDHGPIYAQRPFELPRRATTDEIYLLAAKVAARLLHEVLPRAAAGTLTGVPQNNAEATRARRPRPEDAFVDPSRWRCEHLLDFVTVAPFSRAAWTRLGDEVFFIRRGLECHLGRRLPGTDAAPPAAPPVASVAGNVSPAQLVTTLSLPAPYMQTGSVLLLQCADGVAEVEVQV